MGAAAVRPGKWAGDVAKNNIRWALQGHGGDLGFHSKPEREPLEGLVQSVTESD